MSNAKPAKNLKNKVALVTGASRGIGKGTAIALAKEGATVYISGRTDVPSSKNSLGGSLQETQAEIHSLGGVCIPIRCDHTVDQEVDDLFAQIMEESGKIDLLINCAWGGYEYFNDGTEFWKEDGFWSAPMERWDKMFSAGVRAGYNASRIASNHMIKQGSGLIVNFSFWASQQNDKGVAYGVAKAATDRMTEIMAYELQKHHIAVVCLYPGIVRTEAVLKAADHFDLSNSESTEFMGRIISKLTTDPELMKKSGKIFIGARLALEYGVLDTDGRQPRPLSPEDA